MDTSPIETDYLIVGAGATAMSFADTLLSESEASIVMVDRHDSPGGHWNDAYPFVRLHQPSAFYGVDSRELSSWTRDRVGLNEGLYELASGTEVLSYFDQVAWDGGVSDPSPRIAAVASEVATRLVPDPPGSRRAVC